MNLTQLANKVAGLSRQFQNLVLLGKRFEEFPLRESVDPLSRILVSTAGTTEAIEVQKILDAVGNETQNNRVREAILGTITPEYTLENILDNTGLLVDPDEIVILSVFEAIDSSSDIQQFKQRLFLWKLGKGNFGPIGSDNIDSKLFELPSIFPTEETADEIISAPNAIVRDYGTVTTDILTTINTKSPAVSFNETSEDVTFIYYVRVTIEGVKYLYQFKGINGIYGQGASQMENEDLVLIFSSSNSGPVNNYAYVTKSSLGETVINTVANNVILPENGKSIYNITATGNQVVIGKNKNYLGEATSETVPLGMELKVINSTGSTLSFTHNNSDPNIKPVITPDGQTFEAAQGSVISFIERADSILISAYSALKNSNSEADFSTGTVIYFTNVLGTIYNKTTPANSDLNLNFTGGKVGGIACIFHQSSTAPNITGGEILLFSGDYVVNQKNIIWINYLGDSQVVVNVQSMEMLTAPKNFRYIVSENNIILNWDSNNSNYILERSTTADFSSHVVVYNGPLNSYTDVVAQGIYYYRIKSHKSGFADSLFVSILATSLLTVPLTFNSGPKLLLTSPSSNVWSTSSATNYQAYGNSDFKIPANTQSWVDIRTPDMALEGSIIAFAASNINANYSATKFAIQTAVGSTGIARFLNGVYGADIANGYFAGANAKLRLFREADGTCKIYKSSDSLSYSLVYTFPELYAGEMWILINPRNSTARISNPVGTNIIMK